MGARERMPWNAYVLGAATTQPEVLKWARANGCEWSEKTRSRGFKERRTLSRRRERRERTSID